MNTFVTIIFVIDLCVFKKNISFIDTNENNENTKECRVNCFQRLKRSLDMSFCLKLKLKIRIII